MSGDNEYNGEFDGPDDRGGRELSFDDFLNDSNRAKGGASTFKWREKGSATVYLHPKAPWVKIWGHPWPKLVTYEDKDGDKQKAFSNRRFTCVEDEQTSILKRFFRDKVTKLREHPACMCPRCRFDDWLYASAHVGALYEHCFKKVRRESYELPGLDEKQRRERHQALAFADALVTKMFDFQHPEVAKGLTITVGGGLGLFNDKMSPETKAAFKKANLALSGDDGVWKEKLQLKVEYAWGIVDANAPADGSFIAVETEALGKHMQDELSKNKKRIARLLKKSDRDPEVVKQSDPRQNPYPFEWTYDKAQDFSKKYAALALPDEKPSEAVLAAFQKAAPDMSKLRELGDPVALRAEMEQYCVLPIPVPWDEIFGPSTAGKTAKPSDGGKLARDFKKADAPAPLDGIDQPYDSKSAPAKDETYECDVCGKEQPLNLECVGCGAKYDEESQLVIGAHYSKDADGEPTTPIVARDCVGCSKPVTIPREDPDFQKYKVAICGECGTMHEWPAWKAKPKPGDEKPAELKPAKKRDRRTSAQ